MGTPRLLSRESFPDRNPESTLPFPSVAVNPHHHAYDYSPTPISPGQFFSMVPSSASSSSSSSFSSSSTPPSSMATHTKARELAPFLRQLRDMLNTEPPTVIRWTDDGRAFEICDLQAMTHVILPKYFKHCKYASFQRQLNYFHFRKWTKSRSPLCTFANPFFVRDAPELTWHIVRKRDLASKATRRRAQSFEPASSHASSSSSHSASLSESAMAEHRPNDPLAIRKVAPRAGVRARARAASYSPDPVSSIQSRASGFNDPHGLLQWIDDQFPSIASLELLDDGITSTTTPPAPPPSFLSCMPPRHHHHHTSI